MACVAPYVEDSGVTSYRGRIEKITRNEATILFVDYGNVEQVPLQDLKYLMKVCNLMISTLIWIFRNSIKLGVQA